MALSDSYCTSSDLRDVYPQIDEFDSKNPVFGFSSEESMYIAYNSGVVNALFIDGSSKKAGKKTISTTESGSLASNQVSTTTLVLNTGEGSNFTVNTYIKVGDEILKVTETTSATLTVVRAKFGTQDGGLYLTGTKVYKYFESSSSVGTEGDWLYDSDNDFTLIKTATDLSAGNNSVEAGEEWGEHQTDIIKKASRYFDKL